MQWPFDSLATLLVNRTFARPGISYLKGTAARPGIYTTVSDNLFNVAPEALGRRIMQQCAS